jgi:hypothetical protein
MPVVPLAISTAPVRRTGSTNRPARNPGIEPVWPKSRPDPPRAIWKPRPCAAAIAAARVADWGVDISSSVARERTSSCPVTRNAAYRARSDTVLHTCPAGAIAPASWAGSSVSVFA